MRYLPALLLPAFCLSTLPSYANICRPYDQDVKNAKAIISNGQFHISQHQPIVTNSQQQLKFTQEDLADTENRISREHSLQEALLQAKNAISRLDLVLFSLIDSSILTQSALQDMKNTAQPLNLKDLVDIALRSGKIGQGQAADLREIFALSESEAARLEQRIREISAYLAPVEARSIDEARASLAEIRSSGLVLGDKIVESKLVNARLVQVKKLQEEKIASLQATIAASSAVVQQQTTAVANAQAALPGYQSASQKCYDRQDMIDIRNRSQRF